jgi:flagellar biosynthesis protein
MTPDQKRSSGRPLRHKPAAKVAVALKHDRPEVPKVVASGRGAVADRILDLAFASGVAVREDADLAQMLAAVELDCPIPLPCFEAVSEILAYLYRLNAAAAAPPPTPGAVGHPR